MTCIKYYVIDNSTCADRHMVSLLCSKCRWTYKQKEGQTERQLIGKIDRDTGKQTDRQADGQASRRTGKQTDRQVELLTGSSTDGWRPRSS